MSEDNINSDLQAAIDERLNKALDIANYKITINNQKHNAKLRLEKELLYSINGGTFQITSNLIAFSNTLVQLGKSKAILLDINNNPIEISDLLEFRDNILSKYYEHMNIFLMEIKQIQKSRSIAAVLE